jgi:hypothetical protein
MISAYAPLVVCCKILLLGSYLLTVPPKFFGGHPLLLMLAILAPRKSAQWERSMLVVVSLTHDVNDS